MTVKINDITWTFELVKGTDSNLLFDNEFVYGITCYNDAHVYVSKDLPIELRKRTLLHETVHAVLFSHMLRKYESFTEEEMADFVAKYFDKIYILCNTIMNEWKNESY